jgi:predicted DNA-binding protein
MDEHEVFARGDLLLPRVRCTPESVHLSRAAAAASLMPRQRMTHRRGRVGRPPAGARSGEKVKDYPQVSVRVPLEMKARLNALSAVTGLAQWRLIVRAIDCIVHELPPTDRELVDGLSARLLRAT